MEALRGVWPPVEGVVHRVGNDLALDCVKGVWPETLGASEYGLRLLLSFLWVLLAFYFLLQVLEHTVVVTLLCLFGATLCVALEADFEFPNDLEQLLRTQACSKLEHSVQTL